MIDLNPEQKAAVQSKAHDTAVIAGPGSGKTRVLIERIKFLINAGMNPREIVAITFTNNAANEIVSRLNEPPEDCDSGGNGVADTRLELGYCGTIHGFMLRLIQEFGHYIGIHGRVCVIDELTAAQLMDEAAVAMSWKGSDETVHASIKSGPIQLPGEPKVQLTPYNGIQLVNVDYYNRLFNEGLLDFDSILHFGYRVLKAMARAKHPFPFDAIVIDEAQDCSELHWDIILSLPATRFVVGDVDQSIYAFNGGRPELLMAYTRRDDVTTFTLQHNYRSGMDICGAANRLIFHNKARLDKRLIPQREEPGEIKFFLAIPEPMAEARLIVETLCRNVKPEEYNEVAILTRRRDTSEIIASTLELAGIPVAKKNRAQMPRDWALCRGLIALLSNPHNDRLALWWIKEKRGRAAADKARMAALERMETVNTCELGFDPSGPNNFAVNIPPKLAQNGISVESRELVNKVIQWINEDATVTDLSFRLAQDPYEQDGAGVSVMTIHAAKGREWDTVILPSCEQGICPMERKDSTIEEERRIFFVAITRARLRLIVTACKMRKKFRWPKDPNPVTVDCAPSQFIGELQVG
jgi:superfamily I DNA/RNA helicase